MSNTNYPVQYTIPVQDLDMDWFREQDWQKASSEAFYFFSCRPKSPAPQPSMVFRHHTTTSAYPLDRYQASRCLDYDKAYRRFNSLFLNSDKVKTHGE